jgi:hypothetical protein
MNAEVYTEHGDVKLGEIEMAPNCGDHFCDQCGDCLHCYPSDECRWVVYADSMEDALKDLDSDGSLGARVVDDMDFSR